ncbi:hypothetical protein AT15_09635 [Kosmotoga arenicorallina S304]|uniref:NADH-quinone oxidoreductase n=1 Tax=Kosmotoga arenicorallina S304 TaxID=1453497 RepID=A0A176K0W6_9BACT|nr:NADH-quinone oxidoreductase subunit C [Kosmotoga arenicorallina]OAA30681.1 hypothetical protein AT15_09635 [Kosmotoga arenicorallina S304]
MNPEESKNDILNRLREKIKILLSKKKRIYFKVMPEDIVEVAEYLFRKGLRLSTISAIENYEGFELVYHFSDDRSGTYYCPKVFVPLDSPEVPSISNNIAGAKWIEREIGDLFGVVFIDHPVPKPLLLENNPKIPKNPLRVKRREHE